MPGIEACIELAIELQRIAAPTGKEQARAGRVRQLFTASGLTDVSIDSIGNVYGCYPAERRAGALLLSAHLDTVFPAETDLTLTRTRERLCGPGIADNSLGVAALVWLAQTLREERVLPPCDLWLVANVCEEGNGDLRGMKAVMERLGHTTAAVVVIEGAGLGRVVHRGVGSMRYRLSARAPGGHSWEDFGSASAIHELVGLAGAITRLRVAAEPKTTFNIGIISGGRSVNTIAESAELQLDLRSESTEALAALAAQVRRMAVKANDVSRTVQIGVDVIGSRPCGAIAAGHPLVRLCATVLRELALPPRMCAASTDANVALANGIPAVCIGLTRAGDVHRQSEYLLIEPLAAGLRQLKEVALRTPGLQLSGERI